VSPPPFHDDGKIDPEAPTECLNRNERKGNSIEKRTKKFKPHWREEIVEENHRSNGRRRWKRQAGRREPASTNNHFNRDFYPMNGCSDAPFFFFALLASQMPKTLRLQGGQERGA